MKINNEHKLQTLDYVNIPIKETINTTKTQLLIHNDKQTTNQIITLLETILGQNYFAFQNQIYQPDKGVAMGSPISGTIADVFLQQLEKTHIKHLMDSKHLIFYARYVDDILIIYDSTLTSPTSIQHYVDTIHSNIKLNPTHETNDNISFLDLSITRKPTSLELDIYRKPTATDITINFLSNHPLEHKLAAYRFLINRMLTLLNSAQRQKEWNNIKQIAHNNNIPNHLLTKLRRNIQQKLNHPRPPTSPNLDTKWATFTHTSPHVRKITDLFKNTNVKVAFKSNNTIAQLTKPPTTTTPFPTPYNNSGIYSLTCDTCKQAYVGQTSRSLKIRYQEHIRYINNNDPQSAYAQHILHSRHKYGPIDKTMTLLKPLPYYFHMNSIIYSLSIKKESSSLNKAQATQTLCSYQL
jgi:hypothetical protein